MNVRPTFACGTAQGLATIVLADRPTCVLAALWRMCHFAAYGENRLHLHRILTLDLRVHGISLCYSMNWRPMPQNTERIASEWKSFYRVAVERRQTLFDLEGIWRTKDNAATEQARFWKSMIDLSVKSLSGIIQTNFYPDGFTCSMKLRLSK